MDKPVICTIIAKNYLAQARVLTESFLEHHPDGEVFVLLIDEVNNHFDPSDERFNLVELEELSLPELPEMIKRYDIRELATAVKPSFLQYLFTAEKAERVCYFDPDIKIYGSLDDIFDALRTASMVLTPHLLGPLSLDRLPNEQTILQAGTYNLGFLGLRKDTQTVPFLQWWQQRLVHHSHGRPGQGEHFDQKWINLVPGFLDDIVVARAAGYNVAFWDFQNRRVTLEEGQYFVNNQPLIFFHFSGYDPTEPDTISRYQNRFIFDDIPVVRELFDGYRQDLLRHGYATVRQWPHELTRLMQKLQHTSNVKLSHSATQFGGWGALAYHSLTQPLIRLGLQDSLTQLLGEERIGRVRMLLTNKSFFPLRSGELRKPFGVNVVGYFNHMTGVGEVARQTLKALHGQQVPVAWQFADPADEAVDVPDVIPQGAPYAVNLLHLNVDVLERQYQRHRVLMDESSYSIGWWWWELQQFPQQWQARFQYVDELWVGSQYMADTLTMVTDLPVNVMGVPLEERSSVALPRSTFNLAAKKFLFLFAFDFRSYFERKNPLGLIEAYRLAFGPSFGVTQLVIKVSHADEFPEEVEVLREALARVQGMLLTDMLDRAQMDALFQMADVYVSLHRAEGFGLTLAEAMRLGKPVIATNYSGNTDFMRESNSYLVNYHLTPIERTVGPYEAGALWAEPDLEQAAATMRQLVSDPATAALKGAVAADNIRTQYGAERVALRMKRRLRQIGELVAAGKVRFRVAL